MRGVLALLALFVGGVVAAQLLALVMGPVVMGVLVIGIPWACWQRWKHPERFPDYRSPCARERLIREQMAAVGQKPFLWERQ